LRAVIAELLLAILIVVGVAVLILVYPAIPSYLGLILLIIPILSFLRDFLVWYNKKYVVTNRRVIQISGVINKNVTDSSLEKVNDVKMEQSFWGRLFNFGDVEILTASELGANLFQTIGDPIRFKTAMLNAKEELESGRAMRQEAEEDIPALIARLDTLRQQGIITPEEFQRKKAELLAKL
ncbi:MAG TPA: PH domain-containing protein, partial [Anaerolineaceae bacterium]|nr:PH domain-containing protein [Anaerolineaceae bacterium]